MSPSKTKQIDAIRLLEQDHETLRELLRALSETTNRAAKGRRELLQRVGAVLRAHARIEEEIFYPAFARAARTNEQRKLLTEAYEEHRAAERLVLPDLEGSDVGSNVFGGRAKVLKDLVEHHAEEEERELFPVARRLLDRAKLLELGDRMQARKDELLR